MAKNVGVRVEEGKNPAKKPAEMGRFPRILLLWKIQNPPGRFALHLSYFFLRRLAAELAPRWVGAVVHSLFSQSKDELVLALSLPDQSDAWLRALVSPTETLLAFPSTYNRARSNSVDLFPDLIGQTLLSVHAVEGDRSLVLGFSQNLSLIYKLHGARANVVLLENGQPKRLFNQRLKRDWELSESNLSKTLHTPDTWPDSPADWAKAYPWLVPIIQDYWLQQGWAQAEEAQRQVLYQDLMTRLARPDAPLYLVDWQGAVHLSLVPLGEVLETYSSAVEAANHFARAYGKAHLVAVERLRVLRLAEKRIAQTGSYLLKTEDRLRELEQGPSPSQLADLLMANLHAIPAGASEVTLANFYQEGQPITLSLKPELSAQKNAEAWYRKAKNRQREIDRLYQSWESKSARLAQLQALPQQVGQINDLAVLRALIRDLNLDAEAEADADSLPYHEMEYLGWRVWLGRNAKANEDMLRRHTLKDDLWLHAKDVPGSHVVVKRKAGQNFPEPVVEWAAALAAWHSKARTEGLVAVMVTPRKWVRKRRGGAPGEVAVDRHETRLVVPQGVEAS